MLSPARAAAGDYTAVMWTGNVMILGGLGGLKIDPWGFLLPLTPIVWAAALMALLSVLALLKMFSFILSNKTIHHCTFSPVRVLLQQGETLGSVSLWCLASVRTLREQQSCPNKD